MEIDNNKLDAEKSNQPNEERNEKSDLKSTFLHIFYKTGGEQPTVLDVEDINHFFIGNLAKTWAMKDGFISKFKHYYDGEIVFDIISDPRFKDNEYLLSKFIAEQYKNNVLLLKNATSFQAYHFKTKDIIGFLVEKSSNSDVISKLEARIKISYETLPERPALIHHGSLK